MTTSTTPQFIKISKNVEIVTASPYGWFYSDGRSITSLHNLTHNELAIVVPGQDFYISIKLTGTRFKKEKTLLKIYASYCEKFNIKNIFA